MGWEVMSLEAGIVPGKKAVGAGLGGESGVGLERSSSGTHLEPEPIDLDGMLYRKERLLRVTPRDSS